MRKGKLMVACALLLSSTILFSSCVGSFGLFNRLSEWNRNINDNKFVNELIFIVLTPVYVVAYVADLFVINSIEFWSGKNPMANVGEIKTVKGENGDYLVETLENGYSITKDGQVAQLIYNQETNTWSVVADGTTTKLLKFNDDGTAQLFLPDGGSMDVTLDAKGVLAARQVVMSDTYFAAR